MKVRIPSGVVDGQKLRVPGKGGKGIRGGRDGDLYLDIQVELHPLYRAEARHHRLDLRPRRAEKVVQSDNRRRLSAALRKPTDQGGANVPYAGQQRRHRPAF